LRLALLAACVAGVIGLPACGGSDSGGDASAAREPIAIFGDSLTFSAEPYLQRLADADRRPIIVRAQIGYALCDWIPEAEALLRQRKVAVLVLTFAGNNQTSCMHGLQGSALAARYERDARRLVRFSQVRGIPVVLAGPPAMNAPRWTEDAALINERFRAIAHDAPGVHYVATGKSLSPHGFTLTLPCLPEETPADGCENGKIVVRASDGVHFDMPRPDGYSSGSSRFARVLFDAAGGAR
jgi:hypothetical protein